MHALARALSVLGMVACAAAQTASTTAAPAPPELKFPEAATAMSNTINSCKEDLTDKLQLDAKTADEVVKRIGEATAPEGSAQTTFDKLDSDTGNELFHKYEVRQVPTYRPNVMVMKK